jgi:hypothetical protein
MSRYGCVVEWSRGEARFADGQYSASMAGRW